MSNPITPEVPQSPARRGLLGRILLFGFLAFVLFLLFASFVAAPIRVIFVLASGWMSFLARTVPRIEWNWDLVLMAMLCVTLILLGGQWLLNWLWQATRATRSNASPEHWRWNWTWCGLAALAVFFLVGMAVGGIVHQVGWMASSPEPMMEAKGLPIDSVNMRQLDMALQEALSEPNTSIVTIRNEASRQGSDFFGHIENRSSLLESYQVLLIMEADGSVKGALIFPRNISRRERAGVWYVLSDNRGPKPAKELDALINRHREQLVAL